MKCGPDICRGAPLINIFQITFIGDSLIRDKAPDCVEENEQFCLLLNVHVDDKCIEVGCLCLSHYSPHDHGIVNCSLHFGQHHMLVIVTQLLNVTQHQLNPEHITVTRVIFITSNLLQLRYSRQVIVGLSERCHQVCGRGSPAAFCTHKFNFSKIRLIKF